LASVILHVQGMMQHNNVALAWPSPPTINARCVQFY